MRRLFARLFRTRRTFTIRQSRLYVNGREATPEEAAEALEMMEGVDTAIEGLSEALDRTTKDLCSVLRRASKRPA